MKKYLFLAGFLSLFLSAAIAQPPRPKFTINPRNLNFNSVGVGKTKQLTVALRVDSTAAGDVHVVCQRPLTPHYSIVGDTAFTIVKGTSHTLTVQCAPQLIGMLQDSFYITHDGDTSSAKSPTKIRLSGTGLIDTFPKISVTPGFLNFGNVEVGKTLQRSFLIRNTSDTTKSLTGNVSEAHAPYAIQGGGGLFTLLRGDSLRIYVNFTPTATGNVADSIIVTSNADDANKTKKIYIFGAGTGVDTFPRITVQPRQIGFGSVAFGKDSTRTVTIRNTSTSKKTLNGSVGPFMGTSGQFTVVSGSGAFSLDSGETHAVQLRYTPSATGLSIDSLFVTSNADDANDNIRISVFGTGVDTSSVVKSIKVSFTTTGLDFGLTSASTQLTLMFTIKNISDSAVTLNGNVSGVRPPFGVANGPFTLARNESKEVTVTFNSANPGVFTDSIVVTTNATEAQFKTNVIRLRGEVASSGSVRDRISDIRLATVSPNPLVGSSTLMLELDRALRLGIELHDAAGATVRSVYTGTLEEGVHSIPFSVEGLSTGMYFLTISDGQSQSQVLKVIVNK